jgi:glycosyltransferase involved in cell wall biosynthesis
MPDRKNRASVKLDKKLEPYFISRASVVLTTTQRLTSELVRRYPPDGERIATLTNGYDPDDFSMIPRKKAEKFTISYLGTLYRNRDPEPVLRAVATLIEKGRIDRSRVVLKFIGDCAHAAGKPMESIVGKYNLNGNIELLPWLPKRRAYEAMVQSHALLLLAEDQQLMIPAKVYDYLGAGADILALTEDGATADLLHEVGKGAVARPNDNAIIERSIETFYGTYLGQTGDGPHASRSEGDRSAKYSRENVARQLAQLLDKARSRPPVTV